ncbi:MAG TPA: type II toxin-antitoxin system ParD family antitoxin [Thermoguttaceae bacterium]|nr:type II toxin-antitoxin system ParD family antitoxin [Thermoguttaceae bacterium]
MDTMNIALPESMKQFVHEQIARGGYSSASEYVRDLIRSDQKEKARAVLEAEMLKGLASGDASAMTDADWREIREEIRHRHARRRQT